jgi:hypothetical protein
MKFKLDENFGSRSNPVEFGYTSQRLTSSRDGNRVKKRSWLALSHNQLQRFEGLLLIF